MEKFRNKKPENLDLDFLVASRMDTSGEQFFAIEAGETYATGHTPKWLTPRGVLSFRESRDKFDVN